MALVTSSVIPTGSYRTGSRYPQSIFTPIYSGQSLYGGGSLIAALSQGATSVPAPAPYVGPSQAAYAAPPAPIVSTGSAGGGGGGGNGGAGSSNPLAKIGSYLPYIAIAGIGIIAIWYFSRRHDQSKKPS